MRGIVLFPIINCSGAMVEITSTEMTLRSSMTRMNLSHARGYLVIAIFAETGAAAALNPPQVKLNAHRQRLELPDGILALIPAYGAKLNRNSKAMSAAGKISRSEGQPEQPLCPRAD